MELTKAEREALKKLMAAGAVGVVEVKVEPDEDGDPAGTSD